MIKRLSKLTILLLLVTLLGTTGVSCSRGGSQAAKEAVRPVRLTFWSVHDNSSAYQEIISDYNKIHPNVNVQYRKLRFEEYDQALLEAFARNEGPDIYSVHNTQTRKYIDLLEPMPAAVRIPYTRTVGTLKKEQVTELVTQNMYTPTQVRDLFGDTVADDATIRTEKGDQIYALPMALDTLALYYNKDILNNAGIPVPATFWPDVQAQVESISRIDSNGDITLAAIPVGTSSNVTRSFDILSLLMMQLQAVMIQGGEVVFDKMPAALAGQAGITQPPGINALEFYTSFADPSLTSYTWDNTQQNSLDAFIDGESAYFLGYAYHRPEIEARAPRLNFSIAPMLQIQGYDPVNFANYWLQGVSNKSTEKDFAWDFVRYMTTAEAANKYLNKTRKPAALRSLYNTQLQNEDIAVFTEQTLTAKSWYRGADSNAAEDIFAQMIDSVNDALVTPREAVETAAIKIQQTLR